MAKRKIAIADFVADVRSGLSEIGLMEKYQLSADQLQAVLQQLVEAGKLDLSDLEMTPPKTGTHGGPCLHVSGLRRT